MRGSFDRTSHRKQRFVFTSLSIYIHIYCSVCGSALLPCCGSAGPPWPNRFRPNPRYAHVALCGAVNPRKMVLHRAALRCTAPVRPYTAPVNAPPIHVLACASRGDDDWCYAAYPPEAGLFPHHFSPTLASVLFFEKTNSNKNGSVRFWCSW